RDLDGLGLSEEHREQGLAALRILGSPREGTMPPARGPALSALKPRVEMATTLSALTSLPFGGSLRSFLKTETPPRAFVQPAAVAAYRRGLAASARGDSEAARDALREAVSRQPDMAEAWAALGLVHAEAERLPAAIEAFREVVRLKPSEAAAWSNLGTLYRRLRQHAQAIGAYQAAVRHQPDLVEAWTGLAAACQHAGQRAEAVDACRAALRLRPGHARTWFQLASLYEQGAEFD